MLVVYEDMQTDRLLVLRSIFTFLGVAKLPSIQRELMRQETQELDENRTLLLGAKGANSSLPSLVIRQENGSVGKTEGKRTHWRKASENVCEQVW